MQSLVYLTMFFDPSINVTYFKFPTGRSPPYEIALDDTWHTMGSMKQTLITYLNNFGHTFTITTRPTPFLIKHSTLILIFVVLIMILFLLLAFVLYQQRRYVGKKCPQSCASSDSLNNGQ